MGGMISHSIKFVELIRFSVFGIQQLFFENSVREYSALNCSLILSLFVNLKSTLNLAFDSFGNICDK